MSYVAYKLFDSPWDASSVPGSRSKGADKRSLLQCWYVTLARGTLRQRTNFTNRLLPDFRKGKEFMQTHIRAFVLDEDRKSLMPCHATRARITFDPTPTGFLGIPLIKSLYRLCDNHLGRGLYGPI